MSNARDTFRENPLIQVLTDRHEWVRLRVLPTLESRQKVVEFLRPRLDGLPGSLCEALLLAADELLGNSIEHGCLLNPNQCVEIALVRTRRLVLVHIRDDGPGFSLSSIGHAAVSNPPDKPLQHTELRSQMGMRPGGFGIMLVKQVADELIYDEDGNEVLFIKYLDGIEQDST